VLAGWLATNNMTQKMNSFFYLNKIFPLVELVFVNKILLLFDYFISFELVGHRKLSIKLDD